MENQYDVGMQEDYNNMTEDLGREVTVYPRDNDLDYGGQEDTASGLGEGVKEVVFLQELDTKHEMIQAGQLKVGDVKFTFKSYTIAEEEGFVKTRDVIYKILALTFVRNMSNDIITYVKAFGKKIPNR